jgi:hypothetical protein
VGGKQTGRDKRHQRRDGKKGQLAGETLRAHPAIASFLLRAAAYCLTPQGRPSYRRKPVSSMDLPGCRIIFGMTFYMKIASLRVTIQRLFQNDCHSRGFNWENEV